MTLRLPSLQELLLRLAIRKTYIDEHLATHRRNPQIKAAQIRMDRRRLEQTLAESWV